MEDYWKLQRKAKLNTVVHSLFSCEIRIYFLLVAHARVTLNYSPSKIVKVLHSRFTLASVILVFLSPLGYWFLTVQSAC